MKKYIIGAIFLIILNSCAAIDKEHNDFLGIDVNHTNRFYVTTEQNDPSTKVFADENLMVLWNAGDLLSVFNHSTYNSKFIFLGDDGDNAGNLEEVVSDGFHSGNSLSNIYAVYPYAAGNRINNAGNVITIDLPVEQQYKAHSFGIGANSMVAVTDYNYMSFKNIGGYLQLRLYGDNVRVSRITIEGNRGEKIAGKANVSVGFGTIPSVTMDNTATGTVSIVCDPPVQLGKSSEQYTDFWFVIPPVTFSEGFTITVIDELGAVFQKTTTSRLTISRSTIEWMAALKVTPNYDDVNVIFADDNFKAYCVDNFDIDHNGEISVYEASVVTSINTNYLTSLQGIEYFTSLRHLSCGGQLSTINLSNNTELTFFACSLSQLTSLDVSNNPKLDSLICYSNQITNLDLSNNLALSYLDCGINRLQSLDLSNNSLLACCMCDNNMLTNLDVSNNLELTYLICSNNLLQNLDVSHNTFLKTLQCQKNPPLKEIWLKTGQIIPNFTYDSSVATIKRKD